MKKELYNIKGFDGYKINEDGEIYNVRTGRKMKASNNGKGYRQLQLSVKGVSKNVSIHRVVFTTFVSPIPKGLEINHIDGDKSNNSLNNLELVSHIDNMIKAVETGLIKSGSMAESSKGVNQLDVMTNEVLNNFGSISIASRKTNVSLSSISAVCRGRRITAGGFKWAFTDF